MPTKGYVVHLVAEKEVEISVSLRSFESFSHKRAAVTGRTWCVGLQDTVKKTKNKNLINIFCVVRECFTCLKTLHIYSFLHATIYLELRWQTEADRIKLCMRQKLEQKKGKCKSQLTREMSRTTRYPRNHGQSGILVNSLFVLTASRFADSLSLVVKCQHHYHQIQTR